MRSTVFFDMDGVLVDSRAPIAACMTHALAKHGLVPPGEESLHGYIGPPLYDAFVAILGSLNVDLSLAPVLVEDYREQYRDTCIDATPAFDGIADLLAGLAPAYRLGVVTSKPTAFAIPILTARGFAHYMDVIEGPTLDARSEPKAVTLARALTAVGTPPAAHVTIVGDRSHDILAGRAHGIRTIGVLWGIGSRAELEEAGADRIIATPSALPECL